MRGPRDPGRRGERRPSPSARSSCSRRRATPASTRAMRPRCSRTAERAAVARCRRRRRAARAFFAVDGRTAWRWSCGGDGRQARRQIRARSRWPRSRRTLRDDPRLLPWLVIGSALAARGRRRTAPGRPRARDGACRRSALGALPFLLQHVARDQATTEQPARCGRDLRRGDPPRARDRPAHGARRPPRRPRLAGGAPGTGGECRAHADEARALCGELGVGLYDAVGRHGARRARAGARARGPRRRALRGAGRAARAARRHRRRPLAGRRARRRLPARSAAGRRRARSPRASPRGREAKGQPWSLARAARCRGLLAADDELDGRASRRRSALHARTPDAFETARTRLAYGARLRRARRRASTPASSCGTALARFDRLGAAPWAERARTRARSHRRDRAPARREHAGRAHAAGAADRAPARRRAHDARGRRRALPQPQDDRVPPAPRLPQARHPLTRGARAGARDVRRAVRGRRAGRRRPIARCRRPPRSAYRSAIYIRRSHASRRVQHPLVVSNDRRSRSVRREAVHEDLG